VRKRVLTPVLVVELREPCRRQLTTGRSVPAPNEFVETDMWRSWMMHSVVVQVDGPRRWPFAAQGRLAELSKVLSTSVLRKGAWWSGWP
jgi:hypothetical protein